MLKVAPTENYNMSYPYERRGKVLGKSGKSEPIGGIELVMVLFCGCFVVPSAFEVDRLFIVPTDAALCVCERNSNRVGYAERSLNRSAHIIP